MSDDNSINLGGIFSGGYGIIPKNLMKMKFDDKVGKQRGKNIKLVLAYMLTYTGAGKDTCFPSIKTMSEDLEVSKDVIVTAIKNAVHLKLLDKYQKYPDNPLKHNNEYKLNFLSANPNYDVRVSRTTVSDGSTFEVATVEQNINNINNNKYNKNTNNKVDFELPDSLKRDSFKEKWKMWLDYRKSLRKPMPETTVKLQFEFLDKHNGDAEKIILRSIENGWAGLFPLPKKKSTPKEDDLTPEQKEKIKKMEAGVFD